ncbi:lysine N(6)-hydroxylase/L-ornithine N(5)-oxygenase family protein [Planomonospora parontospora]|uniref:lysine N(6)-hydroxylase/L-ornithine N(5)-oxygenase family protein n=1 Tax=Planomonospora parontospora TaxID=58119 RepID=UPI00166FA3E4|nr:SidA/IucD/PvdA family monooxygenase [Planomonospora parontospora]GGL14381.1 L-ornithine 5-monooxygenase [Planomonospora parontospora subsp. antibiotica]GII17831.1 L-ornithine 5-monooxygenase [Planomonospora parontospora subsp. antibiotica]
MNHQEVEVLAIGAGPSNLALAVALEELSPELASRTLLLEQHEDVSWQRGMLLPWAQSQVSFLKDLVTLRNPRSRFSFVNYLHSAGRLNEFVNLGSFTPYRSEISEYLLWVAQSLSRVRIEYSRRCVRIEPVLTSGGEVEEWRAELGDGSTVTARTLVVGAGRDPHIPEVFGALPRERIIHSTEYTRGISRFDHGAPHRVAVIGGAQSAAEMLWATHQGMPEAQCTMVMRSIGLNGYESSRFTNELFYSSFIDEFYGAKPEARRQLLSEMHRSNYAGLSPGLLDTLYRQIYLERLNGAERLRMITMAEITAAGLDGDEIVLTLTDRKSGNRTELPCDILLLGTGFDRRMPWLVRDLAARAGLEEITVDRVYRLGLPPGSGAACYLQGVNEDTHGIADSLLSVLATRAEEIVGDIQDRLAATELLAPFALPVAS